jgi:hypothetical protein
MPLCAKRGRRLSPRKRTAALLLQYAGESGEP